MEQTNVPKQKQTHRLRTLLEEFRLTKIADTMGIKVSGGERRRTEIARALAVGEAGPKFILLDEPFAGIDPIAVSEIQTIIRNLRERDMGVLITDHNVRETLSITDRAYIMREGEVFADGSSRELADDPDVRKYYLGEKFHF
jgi:lipopolysaccharide export system ATP-binding protein